MSSLAAAAASLPPPPRSVVIELIRLDDIGTRSGSSAHHHSRPYTQLSVEPIISQQQHQQQQQRHQQQPPSSPTVVSVVHHHPQLHHHRPHQQQQSVFTGLFLAFCTGGPSTFGTGFRGMLNKFVSWRNEGYWHVEAVFRCRDNRVVAWHCTSDGPLQCCTRDNDTSYRSSKWTLYSLALSNDEIQRMWQFLLTQNEKPYNWRGLVFNFMPTPIAWLCGTSDANQQSWFCSELVMAALKYVREHEFRDYRPSRTSIKDLFVIIRKHRCFSPMIDSIANPATVQLQFV
jgi:hypothetical protein